MMLMLSVFRSTVCVVALLLDYFEDGGEYGVDGQGTSILGHQAVR